MTTKTYSTYTDILRCELIPALGCTEPIAIAYAAGKARQALGRKPERIDVYFSGNIFKNVKGVTVPNSGGMKGVDAAAILGAVGGDPERALEILETVTPEDVAEAKRLRETGFCRCFLLENEENLYIRVEAFAGKDSALTEIRSKHTHITRIEKNGECLFSQADVVSEKSKLDYSLLNVKDILEYADAVRIEDVAGVLDRQIEMNGAISEEGLTGRYGANVGKVLLDAYGYGVVNRAKATAAAGSDARMSGCTMPVVINSGSGNQGMTASLPVIVYAKEKGISKEKLYRCLVVSNLVAIHQKRFIGSLSAYCGAVSAACGSGAAITYMCGGDYDAVCRTITNTIVTADGIVCDGAKGSCAAKIALAVECALTSHYMSQQGQVFKPGDGLVKNTIEETIASVGRMGRIGMHPTDVEILNIMME